MEDNVGRNRAREEYVGLFLSEIVFVFPREGEAEE